MDVFEGESLRIVISSAARLKSLDKFDLGGAVEVQRGFGGNVRRVRENTEGLLGSPAEDLPRDIRLAALDLLVFNYPLFVYAGIFVLADPAG